MKGICRRLETDSKIVLLTGLGEAVAELNLSVLATPAHAMSVANLLNGVPDSPFSTENGESTVRFTAPDADILIVDDVDTNLHVTEGLLQPYEMRITLCKSGKASIEAIAEKPYDLVLMDHMMPDMDGMEAVTQIRALDRPYAENMPIVAFTANAVYGSREIFMENGFDDFLSKPVDIIKLNAILEKWLPKEKQKRSVSSKGVETLRPGAGIRIEGLNVQKGIAMSGGTAENYKRTLGIFLRDGAQKIGEIKKCLETDDLPLYIIHVHSLKSAAANIGADELSALAFTLEAAGHEGDLDFIKARNGRLLSELESLLDDIGSVLNADKQGGDLGVELLKAGLSKLAEAIESIDPRAINAAVKDIQPFTQSVDIGGAVEDILQNTLIGEYDDALSGINKLLLITRM